MRRGEILAMVPGRELDVLVAEKVMGVKVHETTEVEGYAYPRGKFVPHYSTDISAAMEIIYTITEKAERDGCGPIVQMVHDGIWHVSIGTARAMNESLPFAICKAALLTLIEEEST